MLIAELDALPPDSPRILLATGRLFSEGFDHPPLDTMDLAMPVSWKGTLLHLSLTVRKLADK